MVILLIFGKSESVIWEFERSHSGNGWVNRGKPVLRQTASPSWKVKLQDWKWVEHAGGNHATKIPTKSMLEKSC